MPHKAAQVQAGLMPAEELGRLVEVLADRYQVVGPVARGSEVRFGEISNPNDLQSSYTHTVLSPKKLFHRPVESLLKMQRAPSFNAAPTVVEERVAVIGIHPCDLAALRLLDGVFGIEDIRPDSDTYRERPCQYKDPLYSARREGSFIVAFNCAIPCEKGFCASMGTGPGATGGYDLVLTDIEEGYLVEPGSEAGECIFARLELEPANEEDIKAKEYVLDRTASQLRKRVDTKNLPGILDAEFDHPYWGELKDRCLACANCTMVCPTCFCYNVTDQISLDLSQVERVRSWDSCLLMQFAEVHGANFRKQREARIKQWVYHKMDYWVSQQGTYGCVGCGRCIRWCPANIDVTDVVARIRSEAEV
jgi:sulfhydrogenase subunit beta (sulfur reductase)